MPEVNDPALIREYADHNSESAFADLVHQHIHLVYSVAFRCVGNSHDAQDITQTVFVILAKKAASLRQRTTLTSWLYETTRFAAAAFLRNQARRRIREQKAYMQSTLNDSDANEVWPQLAPVLEEAMSRLNEKERAILAVRLFDKKTAAETAALLGIRENAAHKRTARALEKLRRLFLQRGIDSSTSLIAEAISANSIQAAPVALANTVIAAATIKGAAAGSSTLTLIKGALKIMAWSKTKTAIITGVVLLLLGGTGMVATKEIQKQQRHKAQRQQYLTRLSPIIKVSPNGSIRVLSSGKLGQLNQSNRSYGHPVSAISFRTGYSRDAIMGQLEQMHYVILTNSPELLRAVPQKTPNMKSAASEMDFSFTNGRVARINFVFSSKAGMARSTLIVSPQ